MAIEIECPKCEWHPDGGAHWQCSCGHVWNTFETFARCPKCATIWNDTECPGPESPGGCGVLSPHIDWYKGLDEEVRKQIEEILAGAPVS